MLEPACSICRGMNKASSVEPPYVVVVDPCTGLWGVLVGILRIAEAHCVPTETRRTVVVSCDSGAMFARERGVEQTPRLEGFSTR